MNPTTVCGRIDFILSLKLLNFPITDLLFTLWNLKNRFPFILSNLVYSFTPNAIFTMTSRFWTQYLMFFRPHPLLELLFLSQTEGEQRRDLFDLSEKRFD
jgi:hypothetical protein